MAESTNKQMGDSEDNYGQAAKQMGKAAKQMGKNTTKQAAVKGAQASGRAAAATVKAGIKTGKAVSQIAAGTAAGGPFGAIISAAWSMRHTLYKILICAGLVVVVIVIIIVSIPKIIFDNGNSSDSPQSVYADLSDSIYSAIDKGHQFALEEVERIIAEGGYDYDLSISSLEDQAAGTKNYDVCYILAAYFASVQQNKSGKEYLIHKLDSVKENMFPVTYEEKAAERPKDQNPSETETVKYVACVINVFDEDLIITAFGIDLNAQYESYGVDTEKAIKKCAQIPISLHCWQGDDVTGFENKKTALSGGIQTTGNYPGKARNYKEVMADLEIVYSFIPGKKRLNLHAIYAISEDFIERDKLESKHFDKWLEWAKMHNIMLDFNPTLFSHAMVKDGLTLSSPDKAIRDFWIRHVKACRKIASYIGEKQGSPCLHNIWIPDGFKDIPSDRLAPRERLRDSLDEIFSVKYDKKFIVDAVESKVFGIGVESYTVGSNEFYLSYAATRGINALLDNGHYHPTETVSDKIPSLLAFFDKVALHVTRPVRWDSDHVVLFEDEIKEIAKEIIRNNAEEKVLIGLDYFDASINRIAAWAVGARNMQKALLYACLQPNSEQKKLQDEGNFSKLMVLNEELKTLPFGAVWDEYLKREKVDGGNWYSKVEQYEKEILIKRV